MPAPRIRPGDGSPLHGTVGGYHKHKCHCDACRVAVNTYNRVWLRKRKQLGFSSEDPRHGTIHLYWLGCGCQQCKAARSDHYRKVRPGKWDKYDQCRCGAEPKRPCEGLRKNGPPPARPHRDRPRCDGTTRTATFDLDDHGEL